MQFEKIVMVEVNGRQVKAVVTVNAPDLLPEDHVDASMVLGAVAACQNRSYVSRHHADRVVRCLVEAPLPAHRVAVPLRLVA